MQQLLWNSQQYISLSTCHKTNQKLVQVMFPTAVIVRADV